MNENDIAFLGLAERASYVRQHNTDSFQWNVLGLKSLVYSALYPLKLNRWKIGIAFKNYVIGEEVNFRICDIDSKQIGTISLRSFSSDEGQGSVSTPPNETYVQIPMYGWNVYFVSLGDVNIVIPEPGVYQLILDSDGEESVIGQMHFSLINPNPFTPEKIAAIKSDPQAIEAVRATFSCNKCDDKINTYSALERDSGLEKEGYTWYKDLPDSFKCNCGKTEFDLSIIRRNFFVLLGRKMTSKNEEISFAPLYEKGNLRTLLTDLRKLLDEKPKEEKLQKFIENNPLLLHQIPSEKMFFKPPISTFFKTDFAILTPQKELVLIEIEKANTKLLNKDGGQAAELTHAFDQVRSWLRKVDDHRLAVLDSLGLEKKEVSKISGFVIAGRDTGYDAEHLRRLKGDTRGRISFLTFDDLAFSLSSLIERMDKIWK